APPLRNKRAEYRACRAVSARVERVPERLTLFGSIELDWAAYRPIEAALLELLAVPARPLPVALLAGSALLSLCIGLTQIEVRARRVGQSPAATLAGGLEELRVGGYRPLLGHAAGPPSPRGAP